MKAEDIKRFKELEIEKHRLKKAAAALALGKQILEKTLRGKQ